jgi:hypothetical protein
VRAAVFGEAVGSTARKASRQKTGCCWTVLAVWRQGTLGCPKRDCGCPTVQLWMRVIPQEMFVGPAWSIRSIATFGVKQKSSPGKERRQWEETGCTFRKNAGALRRTIFWRNVMEVKRKRMLRKGEML